MGYLPEALRNYLVRLGWSHGDQEIFSTAEMIEAFDLAHVGRSPARFDFAKLESMNGHYIRASRDADLVKAIEQTAPYLPRGADGRARARRRHAGEAARRHAGLEGARQDTGRAARRRGLSVRERGRSHSTPRRQPFSTRADARMSPACCRVSRRSPTWSAAGAEAAVRDYVEETKVKLGQVAQPLRAALTGRATSPGIFDVLEVLGREESLGRLQDQALMSANSRLAADAR